MSQTSLIYLHVTASLQLLNCFKRRTSHELNFNTRFQLPSSLRAGKYNFNILVNSQMQCSQFKHKHKSVMECTLILTPFTKEAASLYAKPAKHKLRLSAQSSLTSKTRHFDGLTHNWYFCAYSWLQNTLKIHKINLNVHRRSQDKINLIYVFMYLVRLLWRSASESKPVHSRYSLLSQAWRTAEPIRIISAVSNWFRRRTSHKLNSVNSIRLMWSTASEPGLRQDTFLAQCFPPPGSTNGYRRM